MADATLKDSLELLSAVKHMLPPLSPFRFHCWAITDTATDDDAGTKSDFCRQRCTDDGILCDLHREDLPAATRPALRLAASLALALVETHHAYSESRQMIDALSEPSPRAGALPASEPDSPMALPSPSVGTDESYSIVADAAALRLQIAALQLDLERTRGTSEAAGVALSVLRDSERALAEAHMAAQEEASQLRNELSNTQEDLQRAYVRLAQLEGRPVPVVGLVTHAVRSPDDLHVSPPQTARAQDGGGIGMSVGALRGNAGADGGQGDGDVLLQLSSSRAEGSSDGSFSARQEPGSPAQASPSQPGLAHTPAVQPMVLEDTLSAANIVLRPGVPTAARSPPQPQHAIGRDLLQPATASPVRMRYGGLQGLEDGQADGVPSPSLVATGRTLSGPVAAAVDARAATSLRAAEVARVSSELARLGELRRRMDAMAGRAHGGTASLGSTVHSIGHGGSPDGASAVDGGGQADTFSSPGRPTAPHQRRLTLRLGNSPLAKQVAEALARGAGQANEGEGPSVGPSSGLQMLDLDTEARASPPVKGSPSPRLALASSSSSSASGSPRQLGVAAGSPVKLDVSGQ